ncbi:hypothetical protein FOZ63_023470, partial [Perkinsus olseni]
LYEREHLLDVIWDDGDVELMPHHTARGCLLSEASSEVSPAQDTEGQATTTGKSTRATSTGVKKGRLKGRQPRDRTKQSEPSPKLPSPRSIDGSLSARAFPWEWPLVRSSSIQPSAEYFEQVSGDFRQSGDREDSSQESKDSSLGMPPA